VVKNIASCSRSQKSSKAPQLKKFKSFIPYTLGETSELVSCTNIISATKYINKKIPKEFADPRLQHSNHSSPARSRRAAFG
jgi:hypothetical protein